MHNSALSVHLSFFMVWVDNVIISALTVLRLFTQAEVVCIYDA